MKNKILKFGVLGLVLIALVSTAFAYTSGTDPVRLPEVGTDNGDWGTILNDFLGVSLNSTGHINDNMVNADAIDFTDVTLADFDNDAFDFQFSIQNVLGGITLVGDQALPGNSMFYGTDDVGTRSWYSTSAFVGATGPQGETGLTGDAGTNGVD